MMRAPDWAKCTEEELWKYVAVHLKKSGLDTLLVGGTVVSIYSEGIYRSGDLDFVLLTYLNDRLPELMAQIGFKASKSRHYSHPKCKHLIIEFLSGPPAIGNDHEIKPAEIKVSHQMIKLYSPTDCIRDRLASYIHFRARECLDQAILVAKKHNFDQTKIKRWCQKEGAPKVWEELQSYLKKSARNADFNPG